MALKKERKSFEPRLKLKLNVGAIGPKYILKITTVINKIAQIKVFNI